jgi:hypothetical protein
VVDGHRGTPDISMSAAVDGGVDVFFSFTNFGRTPPVPGPQWHIFGGTSEASPLFAGVVALANQMAGHRLGYLNPHLYELGDEDNSGIVDITKGTTRSRSARPAAARHRRWTPRSSASRRPKVSTWPAAGERSTPLASCLLWQERAKTTAAEKVGM